MKIGIIGAMDEEIAKLKSGINDLKVEEFKGIVFC